MIRKFLSRIRKPKSYQGITLGENSVLKGFIDRRSLKSSITIGSDCMVSGSLITETDESKIIIGNNVFIGANTIIDCVVSIQIEDDVLISYQCILADSDNHSIDYNIRKKDLSDWREGKHDWKTTKSKPILISKGAWIGARAIILKGTTVGEGSIVGAGAVVTKDVPAWTVVGGNPARVIKEIERSE